MAGKDSEGRSDVSATAKKKRPPEFRHLPRDRARKLRKEWIEKKKIKAQWKHEKRKGNIERSEENTDELAGTTTNDAPHINHDSVPRQARHIMKHVSAESERNKPEQATTNPPRPPPPQINRRNHPIRGTDKKRRSVDKLKSEFGTGKRRTVTMREKMGSLLEKIQKNMDSVSA